jgi:hypothetical protein
VLEPGDVPDKPLLVRETTNANAAQQIVNLDALRAAHPTPESEADAWNRMMVQALASTKVPIPPYGFLRDIHGGGAVETLKKLTPDQRAAADFGIEQGRAYREAYTSGQIRVTHTGQLFLWSFLSRERTPYVQESMFIDAFKGVAPWIEKAAEGRFTKADLADYEIWARSVAPSGSGQPGASARDNLLAFGHNFLVRMSAQNDDGVTHLQHLHNMLSDPSMTGQQIRREFLKFGEDTGVDNKVISFTLLVAGHNDVTVLDRIQVRAFFDDGRFRRQNVDVYAGLARVTLGARGLLLYEALEQALERRVKHIYTAAGRPQDASVGRYHWETWQVHSGQEASHGTLGAILAHAKGDRDAIAKVMAIEGKHGAYAHGARYGRDKDNVPYFTYPDFVGGRFAFTVPAYRAFIEAIKRPSSGVVPREFGVKKSGNVPWFDREGVNKPRLVELAGQFADRGHLSEADSGKVVSARPPDGAVANSATPKAADQAAFSHPEQAGAAGDPPKPGASDVKVSGVAASANAALAAAAGGLAENGGSDAGGDDPGAAVRRVLNGIYRFMTSPTKPTKKPGARLIDDPLYLKKHFEDVGFDPAAQTLMKEWNGGLTRALKGTDDAFTEHWKAAGPLDEREFDEAVGRALRNGDEADDPQVARAAKLWRNNVLGPITEAAVKAGLLPDDVDPTAAGTYFSRTWSRGKLFAMEREFKETVAQYAAERMAREQGTGGGGTDIRAKAREIADDLFDTLAGRSEAGPLPDYSVHIPDALAAPFLEDNIELIGRRLIRTIGADLELAQKFGTPDMAQALQGVRGGYEQRRAQAMDESERLALARAERRDIADLEAVRDRIRGRRIESPIERNYARIVRAAQHLDAVRAAGEVGLPSLPDAIRPAMVQGLSAYMQTVDRLAADLKEVTLPPQEAALALASEASGQREHFVVAAPAPRVAPLHSAARLAGQVAMRVLAHRLSSLADIDDPYVSRTPADAFLQKMTDEASAGNGVRIFADMQKSIAAVMVQDRILRAVQERAGLHGIGEDVAAQIAGQFEKHGEEIEGVRVANTQAWDKDNASAAALRGLRAAVNKDMGSFIAKGTPAGEAMLALKNFALASYQRLLLRGLDAKAERFMGGLIAMTAMGMFAAWAASPDVASDPERWIGEGFDRSGIMAVPLELSDAFEKATGFDPLGPIKGPETGTRLLPFNAYPGIRAMLGYALNPHS